MTRPFTVSRHGSVIRVTDEDENSTALTAAEARALSRDLADLADAISRTRPPARRTYGPITWECVTPGALWRSTTHPGYSITYTQDMDGHTWWLIGPHDTSVRLDTPLLGKAIRRALPHLTPPPPHETILLTDK